MEIVLLGAVGLVEGEELLQVGGSTQRQLLAILAARRRTVVGADWLADTLGVSAGGLRASIARLRRVVGADVVVSRSRGYVALLLDVWVIRGRSAVAPRHRRR
jgi:biotin operon repressor